MSGGSLEYVYHKVEDAAFELLRKENTALQRAFGEHLKKVAKALHDVEWVLSGDMSQGDDDESIKAVLGDDYRSKALDVLRDDAKDLIKNLEQFTKTSAD